MTVQPRHPATPSPSATLILARQQEAGIDVYLLRRSAASKFMPGTCVFPGGNLDTLMAEARHRVWPASIIPRLWPLDNGALIIEPWDPDYDHKSVSVDIDRLEADLLPVGVPFSRLWRHRGVCRPVRCRGLD